MPLQFVTGDPLLDEAPILAIDHNRKGRQELEPLHMALMQKYPAAFSVYKRQCRKERINAGQYWLWQESRPKLLFLPVRDSAFGATRLRYVQAVAMQIARNYRLEGLKSLAIAPLGRPHERDEINKVLAMWLQRLPIDVIIYTEYTAE